MIADGRNYFARQLLAGGRARHRDRADRAGPELLRRRPARHLRPAVAAVVSGGDRHPGGRPSRRWRRRARRRGSRSTIQPAPAARRSAVDDVSFERRTRRDRRAWSARAAAARRMTALAVMRLLPPAARRRRRPRPARRRGSARRSRAARCAGAAARDVSMVFQEPMTALDPSFTIGYAARRDASRARPRDPKAQARTRAVEMLELVGIPDAERAARRLPAPVLGRHAPARHDRDGAAAASRSC